MALLTYQKAGLPGVAYALVAASGGGDTVLPSTDGALIVTNGGGSPITVTIVDPTLTKYGQATTDPPTTVPNGQSRIIGPFPYDLANASGLVDITYSGVTSVTVAAVQI